MGGVWEPHIQAPAGGLEPGGRVEGSHGCRGGVRSGLRPLRSAGTFPSASVHPASGGRKLHGGFLCYQILGVTACGQVLLLMIIPDLQQPLEQKDLHQKIAETVFPLASESQVSLEPRVTLLCTAPHPPPPSQESLGLTGLSLVRAPPFESPRHSQRRVRRDPFPQHAPRLPRTLQSGLSRHVPLPRPAHLRGGATPPGSSRGANRTVLGNPGPPPPPVSAARWLQSGHLEKNASSPGRLTGGGGVPC